MPAKEKPKSRSVDANVLNKIRASGAESVVLEQRQRFAVARQALTQYLGPLGACECGDQRDEHAFIDVEGYVTSFCEVKKCGCLWWEQRARAYPHMLPTQANGRWSTTQPPIPNFPNSCLRRDCPHRRPGKSHAPIDAECWDCHRVFKPDPGWYWLKWDKDAVEARINAVLIEDEELIDAFISGRDVHTLTACATFGLPLPPNLVDPHKSPECEPWRREVHWGGKDDLRRRLAKIQRYGCVTMDTQALTRDGWKSYDQLSVGEMILTYNAEKGLKEWKPIQKLTVHLNADVWKLNNKRFSVKVTGDHRWYVRQRRRTGTRRSYRKPYMVNEIRTTDELNTESSIICNAPMAHDEGLGAVLTHSKYGTDWAKEVCRMSSIQRESFLLGFALADGHQDDRGFWSVSQLQGPLMEAVFTAAVIEHHGRVTWSRMREKTVNGTMAQIHLNALGHVTGQRMEKIYIGRENVWCPTTENNTWVMRQGNTVTITGNCFYGPDETAILGAKGVEELDLSRDELLEATRKYLASQPKLQAMKEKRWDEYIRRPEARTVWGRRLRCYPTYMEKENWIKSLRLYHSGRGSMRPGDAQKMLWNFEHSGAVSDHVNRTVILIKARWPECRLVLNKHDSLTVAFPMEVDPWPDIREIDEVTPVWPNGLSIPLTSTWQRVYADGTTENLDRPAGGFYL